MRAHDVVEMEWDFAIRKSFVSEEVFVSNGPQGSVIDCDSRLQCCDGPKLDCWCRVIPYYLSTLHCSIIMPNTKQIRTLWTTYGELYKHAEEGRACIARQLSANVPLSGSRTTVDAVSRTDNFGLE